MKILQAFLFYQPYLDAYHAARSPQVESFDKLQKGLFDDGFSAIHFFSHDLPSLGYEALTPVVNDRASQLAWAREFAPDLFRRVSRNRIGKHGRWLDSLLLAIFIEQINSFKPDVLYLDDPVTFDSEFIRGLKKRPRLVVAWRAASIPRDVDWTEIDVLVSNHTPSLELGRKQGARWQERFMPGFPDWIASRVKNEKPLTDVSFCGSLSIEHARRIRILEELGRRTSAEVDLSYFVGINGGLPSSIESHAKVALWGMDMYRQLADSKINLNIHIDLAGQEAANMRLFETTGVGGFLLTDDKPNIRQYFEPGCDIETFASTDELSEKIRYYLTHDRERSEIARRGQEKCLSRFTRFQSSAHLDEIIRRAISAKSPRPVFWKGFPWMRSSKLQSVPR